MTRFAESIQRLVDGHSLSREESRAAMTLLMSGQATPIQIASFLTALRMKGETVDEITGAAEAMRAAALPVHCKAKVVVDTCGTGGDGQGSFNVSTGAAFVVAGAGYTVAKHGNRSISSRCGSADLLEQLGIPLETTPAVAEESLKQVGIAFLFAPAFHPAMKYAMPVRKELGIRTLFNLLGPLTNPARPTVQLIGLYDPARVESIARVLVQLGCRQGCVVHGQGHDEIVLTGSTTVAEIQDGSVSLKTWTVRDFGLTPLSDGQITGGTARDNADILLKVLKGECNAFRDVICLNAAAAICAASRQAQSPLTLRQSYQAAQDSLDQKRALQKLEQLKDFLASSRSRHG